VSVSLCFRHPPPAAAAPPPWSVCVCVCARARARATLGFDVSTSGGAPAGRAPRQSRVTCYYASDDPGGETKGGGIGYDRGRGKTVHGFRLDRGNPLGQLNRGPSRAPRPRCAIPRCLSIKIIQIA
jgi:hypothetical protein